MLHRKLTKIGLMGALSLCPFMAMGSYPLANINCREVQDQLKLPEGNRSYSIQYGEACKTLFVGPRTDGIKEVLLDPAGSTHLNSCKTLDSLYAVNENYTDYIRSMSEYQRLLAKDILEQNKRVDAYQEDLKRKMKSKSRIERSIASIKEEIRRLNIQIADLERQLIDCTGDTCDVIRADVHNKKQHLRNRKAAIKTSEKDIKDLNRNIAKLEKELKRGRSSLDDIHDNILDVTDKLNRVIGVIDGRITAYSTKFGAEVQIDMGLQWNELVDDIRRLNADLGIKVEKLPIASSEILINAFDPRRALLMQSPVIGRGLPNVIFKPGSSSLTPEDMIKSSSSLLFLPKVNLTLSLLGACHMYDSDRQVFKNDIRDAFLSHFISVVNYEYLVRENIPYVISYDIAEVVHNVAKHFQESDRLTVALSSKELSKWVSSFRLKSYEGADSLAFSEHKMMSILRPVLEQFAKETNAFEMMNASSKISSSDAVRNFQLQVSKDQIESIKNKILSSYPNTQVTEESQGNTYTTRAGTISF